MHLKIQAKVSFLPLPLSFYLPYIHLHLHLPVSSAPAPLPVLLMLISVLLLPKRSQSFSPVPVALQLSNHLNIIKHQYQQFHHQHYQQKYTYRYMTNNKMRFQTENDPHQSPRYTSTCSSSLSKSLMVTKMSCSNLSFTTNPTISLASSSASACSSSSQAETDEAVSINSSNSPGMTDNIIFIGRKSSLPGLQQPESFLQQKEHSSTFQKDTMMFLSAMIGRLTNGNGNGESIVTSLLPIHEDVNNNSNNDGNDSTKLIPCSIISLPDKVSRNNHYMSPHQITELLPKVCPQKGHVQLYIVGIQLKDAAPLAAAIARCFPLYTAKTTPTTTSISTDKENYIHVSGNSNTGAKNKSKDELLVNICFLNEKCQPFTNENTNDDDIDMNEQTQILQSAQYVADGVRLAAKLVDMPPDQLTTHTYSLECQKIAQELGETVTFEEIVGEQLKDMNYGGIYGVGKAAQSSCEPRLIVMTYTPQLAQGTTGYMESVALCGKGVIYDTGGLSIKSKTVSF